MRRTALIMSVTLVLAAVATVPIGGIAAAGGDTVAQQTTEEQPQNETAADVAPGERLSGVLNVGEAELENEVDSRTFGIRIARAASQDAQADVVNEQLDEIEQRVNDLEERKAALDRARENGSLSEGAYQARVSEVAARLEGAKQLANQSERTAEQLPVELLEEKGINVENIQTLKNRAEELGGGEVAEIAQGIAGDSVGQVAGQADSERPGPADDGDRDSDDAMTETPESDERPGNETAGSNSSSDRGY